MCMYQNKKQEKRIEAVGGLVATRIRNKFVATHTRRRKKEMVQAARSG